MTPEQVAKAMADRENIDSRGSLASVYPHSSVTSNQTDRISGVLSTPAATPHASCDVSEMDLVTDASPEGSAADVLARKADAYKQKMRRKSQDGISMDMLPVHEENENIFDPVLSENNSEEDSAEQQDVDQDISRRSSAVSELEVPRSRSNISRDSVKSADVNENEVEDVNEWQSFNSFRSHMSSYSSRGGDTEDSALKKSLDKNDLLHQVAPGREEPEYPGDFSNANPDEIDTSNVEENFGEHFF